MHIVLSGYYGFDNVGDEAILFSIIQALRKLQPDIELTVLSHHPKKTSETYDVKSVSRNNINKIIQALKKSDGLISGGGSLLQDKTGHFTIPYYLGIIKLAKLLKKPVFIYAQGMGPINGFLSELLVKATLNKVNQITVRDEASQHLLKDIGIKQPAKIVPDPVLGLNPHDYKHNWQPINELNQEEFITVSVRNWHTKYPFNEKLAHCLDLLVKDGYGIVFVPMHGKHDKIKSQEIAKIMQEKSYISPADKPLQSKISLIGDSKLLIGLRLHSLIFAAINYTPFVAISYDPKIDAFASLCEQPIGGNVESDNWNGQTLYQQVKNMLSNYERNTDILKEKVQVLQHLARKTPELALSVFSKKAY